MRRPRILIAEDHLMVGQALKALLAEFDVQGPIREGDLVPDAVRRLQPDVLLLDLTLVGRSGMDVLPQLRSIAPELKVIVVTMHKDYAIAREVLRLGAAGFVPKDAPDQELREAIAVVLAGSLYLSSRVDRRLKPGQAFRKGASLLSEAEAKAYKELSERQREVLRLMGEGRSTEEIAEALGVGVHTVHYHRRRIRDQMGIGSDDGLARIAAMMTLSDLEAQAPPDRSEPPPPSSGRRGPSQP